MCYVSRRTPPLSLCSFCVLTPSFDETRNPTGRIKSFDGRIWKKKKKNNQRVDVAATIVEVYAKRYNFDRIWQNLQN